MAAPFTPSAPGAAEREALARIEDLQRLTVMVRAASESSGTWPPEDDPEQSEDGAAAVTPAAQLRRRAKPRRGAEAEGAHRRSIPTPDSAPSSGSAPTLPLGSPSDSAAPGQRSASAAAHGAEAQSHASTAPAPAPEPSPSPPVETRSGAPPLRRFATSTAKQRWRRSHTQQALYSSVKELRALRAALSEERKALQERLAEQKSRLELQLAEERSKLERRLAEEKSELLKRHGITETFVSASRALALSLAAVLLYYNYLMLQPHLAAMFWAAICALVLAVPHELVQTLLRLFDDLLGVYKFKLLFPLSLVAVALLVSVSPLVRGAGYLTAWLALLFLLFGPRPTVASVLVLLGALALMAFPAFFFVKTCYDEGEAIFKRVSLFVARSAEFGALVSEFNSSWAFVWLQTTAKHWGWTLPAVEVEWVRTALLELLSRLNMDFESLAKGAISLANNLGNLAFSLATFGSCLLYFLESRESLVRFCFDISPLPTTDNQRLSQALRVSMERITWYSLAEGLIHFGAALAAFKLTAVDPSLILSFVAGLTAVLPVVSNWLVWAPVILGLYASGAPYRAAALLVVQLVLKLVVDPFVYALIPGNNFVVGLSLVMGLYVFGPAGVLAGPVVASFSLSLLQVYRGYLRDSKEAEARELLAPPTPAPASAQSPQPHYSSSPVNNLQTPLRPIASHATPLRTSALRASADSS